MNDEQMQPLLEVWLRDRDEAPRDTTSGIARVMGKVPEVRQRSRWWLLPVLDRPAPIPATSGRQPARGFTLFSALKFIAATAIVALFGGFLLAGVLTTEQGDEALPAAVTESPTPMTTEELLSGMVTEEVEPGVYRVLDDGAGHPMGVGHPVNAGLYVGPDGAVWVRASNDDVEGAVMWQLGVPGRHEQGPAGDFSDPFDFATAPDGTLWVAGYAYLSSYDGDSWTRHPVAKEPSREWPLSAVAVEVQSDGTVWAAWDDRLGRLDAEGWQYYPMEVDGWLRSLVVQPDGSVLAFDGRNGRMLHFDGAEWLEVPMLDTGAATHVSGVRIGSDGTLWVHFISRSTGPGRMDGGWWGSRWWDSDEVPQDHLAHYDGETWTTYSAADGLPRLTHALKQEPSWDVHPDGSVWVLADPEQAMESDPYSLLWTLRSFDGDRWTEWSDGVGLLDIGPDGTVWMGKPGPDIQGDYAEGFQLASFDGATWRQYRGLTFTHEDFWGGLDVAPDGSAWVVAEEDQGLYVIRP